MNDSWGPDLVKAGLIVAGLALAIGYQDELRAAGRQVAASVSEFAGSLNEPEAAQEATNATPPVVPVPACRRTVTYVVVRQPTCRPVVRSCH